MTTEELAKLLEDRITEERHHFEYLCNKAENDGYEAPANNFHEYVDCMTNVELLNMLTDSYI